MSSICGDRKSRNLPAALAAALCSLYSGFPAATAQHSLEKVGRWSTVMNVHVVAIHTHVLPTGKVLFWPRNERLTPGPVDPNRFFPRLWDPATNSLTAAAQSGYNNFCSGHSLLPDGRLFVAGGHVKDLVGLANASLYDPIKDAWQQLPPMNAGRWYPTAVTLPNGDMLVVSGSIQNGEHNKVVQVWGPKDGWRTLKNADPFPDYDLYPWLHAAPDGRVFASGPQPDGYFLDTAGNGRWVPSAKKPPGRDQYRDYGSSVMYEPGKVLVVGGGQQPALATAEKIDLTERVPTWSPAAKMKFPRRQLNATILPDGKVLVTGGTSLGWNDANGAVLDTELWDPASDKWTLLAPQSVRRMYHSTAVLLPDGRVLSAGGGEPFGDHENDDHPDAQVFSPPYLFQSVPKSAARFVPPHLREPTRPKIDNAPDKVKYSQRFMVATKDGGSIRQVTWLRLSSVTHAFNANQRFLRLTFKLAQGGLTVTAPENGNLAPPGHYMLFVLDKQGVPSVAKIISLG